MNQPIKVTYYDGVVSKPREATLSSVDKEHIVVKYQDDLTPRSKTYHRDDLIFMPQIGRTLPAIDLKDEARIQFHQMELPDWVPVDNLKFNHRVWKLERAPALILFSVIFVLCLGFIVLKWGVPYASQLVAYQLPESTLKRIGDQSEKYVFDYTGPSKLSLEKQQQIQKYYLDTVAENRPAQLKFRSGRDLGANALALPNNTIIVTDELVKLTKNNDEIIGVLAHEQGHLIKRHSLQQALSSLGFSVLYIAMTGDSSDLLSGLPLAMLGAGYSRKFERESDSYALELMKSKQLDTQNFANFLKRLGEDTEDEQSSMKILNIFSSHPATAERVKMAEDFAKQANVKQVTTQH